MKKDIIIMFGGDSPEHEVSIITGLQVVENIDQTKYTPHTLYVTKNGEIKYISNLKSRKEFGADSGESILFGIDKNGGFIQTKKVFSKKIYPYAAYLAFHGGGGEGGAIQGLLSTFKIPFTSTSYESSVLLMNKQLTKTILEQSGLDVVPGVSVSSTDIKKYSESIVKKAVKTLELPLIVKPVHFGSSIGIKVAKSEIELEKALLEAAYIDNEVLIEKYIPKFTEYNCAVRMINGEIEVSEIEKPKFSDEILSFADKYERGGGKKSGAASGMASLERELPAKIDSKLKEKIEMKAKHAFTASRCKGMVRIDFMNPDTGELYITEINPIPGSMAFYLWEATGITFTQQITDLIEQSVVDHQSSSSLKLDYKSDIVEKFIAN